VKQPGYADLDRPLPASTPILADAGFVCLQAEPVSMLAPHEPIRQTEKRGDGD